MKNLVLGFDIGGTNVRVAVGVEAEILAARSMAWPDALSPMEEIDFLADRAQALIDELGFERPIAAGASLAALVDPNGTVVNWPNRAKWKGLAFRSLLQTKLQAPVAVEDDANAAALAEARFGAAIGYQHALVMTVGTGIGGGLILDGRLFRGPRGWAGEIGHLKVTSAYAAVCSCGRRGCLQSVASGRVLDQIAIKRGMSDGRALVKVAERGETWALNAIEEAGRWLGLGASNIVNLLDLEAVVIGGGLSLLGQTWWKAVHRSFRENLLNAGRRDVALLPASLPETAGILGALCLASGALGPRTEV
jgi:glucokinase